MQSRCGRATNRCSNSAAIVLSSSMRIARRLRYTSAEVIGAGKSCSVLMRPLLESTRCYQCSTRMQWQSLFMYNTIVLHVVYVRHDS
jgi:hypothetical protein